MTIHARLIVFIAFTLIQFLYEGALYPGLKSYDKWIQSKVNNRVGEMERINQT